MQSSDNFNHIENFIISKAKSNEEINAGIKKILNDFREILPKEKSSVIVIKPNLNSNMNALTGNTTDLRILAAIVNNLKEKGYYNIIIAEGTNSGYYRQGINVIHRLRVDRLAKALDVEIKDTNYDESIGIKFEDGVTAYVAKTFMDADFLINVPKIKMHYETEMSVCLKNLIGTLVGMENKKKTHSSLINNICNINDNVKPDLHIVDGVIAMEGNGPTTGTPVPLGLLVAGTNPFVIDMIVARLVKCPFDAIPVLVEAERRGCITQEEHTVVNKMDLQELMMDFKRPDLPILTRIVTNKKLQKYFLKVRHAPVIRKFFNSQTGNRLLFKLKLTQEVMIEKDQGVFQLSHDSTKCDACGTCNKYCPKSIDPIKFVQSEQCIECLYCYSVCPNNAFGVQGDLGFYYEQLNQYDKCIRSYASKI